MAFIKFLLKFIDPFAYSMSVPGYDGLVVGWSDDILLLVVLYLCWYKRDRRSTVL